MGPNNTPSVPQENKAIVLSPNVILLSTVLLGLLLFITGAILLSLSTETNGREFDFDYTDCMKYNDVKTCKEALKTKQEEPCFCYVNINLTQALDAPVTAYYELSSYDYESNSSYYNSRDDRQLSGDLSMPPSPSCEPYAYVDTAEGKKPIAPCGAVADTMFNDTFFLRNKNDTKYIQFISTGLIPESDKALYQNPPGNLTIAFQNYSRPKNWGRDVWDLDKNATNNGFQNEAFIAWMKTEWKQKPIGRVQHTDVYEHGLPAGVYILRVNYAYPPSRYDGQRKFIISSMHLVINPVKRGFGILLLLVGCLVIVAKVAYNRKKYGKYLPTVR